MIGIRRKHTGGASEAGNSVCMKLRAELWDFLVRRIPGMALAGFQASHSKRRGVWALITKENETGVLSEEKRELDDALKPEHRLKLAKTKAWWAAG